MVTQKQYDDLEALYLNVLTGVHRDAGRIFGIAVNGRSEDAAHAAAELSQKVRDYKEQYLMRNEAKSVDGYDLSGLNVTLDDNSPE